MVRLHATAQGTTGNRPVRYELNPRQGSSPKGQDTEPAKGLDEDEEPGPQGAALNLR